jgi:hypothetical protein
LEDETPEYKATAEEARSSGKVQRCAEDNKTVEVLHARVKILERILEALLRGDNGETA